MRFMLGTERTMKMQAPPVKISRPKKNDTFTLVKYCKDLVPEKFAMKEWKKVQGRSQERTKMGCCSTRTCGITGLTVGVVLILLGSLGGFLGFPELFKSEVRKQAVLVPGTDTWEAWLQPPIKIYMNFTFFNVANPTEVQNGSKPILTEVGPFVYEEILEKEIVNSGTDKGTVLYKEKTTWVFQREMTAPLTDEQMVTIINPVLTTIAAKLDSLPRKTFAQQMLFYSAATVLSQYDDESLFVTHSARELLFDGYDSLVLSHLKTILGDQIPSSRFDGLVKKKEPTLGHFLQEYVDTLSNPIALLVKDILRKYDAALVSLGVSTTMIQTPAKILFEGFPLDPYVQGIATVCSDIDQVAEATCDDLSAAINQFLAENELVFGFFSTKNGTDEGVFEIENGKNNADNLGLIRSWNGNATLDYWPDLDGTNSCNKINGTDGTLFGPLTITKDKEKRLYLFVTDLCRSLYMTYDQDVTHFGITTRRYTVPPDALAGPVTNADNMCYCETPETPEKCPGSTLGLGPCQYGAPVKMSTPHFYMTDSEALLSDFDGVKPVQELHETYLDLDPVISVPVSARKRIQINMKLKKTYPLPSFQNLKKDYIFPIMWVEEGADFDQASADLVKQEVYSVISLLDGLRWGLIGVGIAVTVLGGILMVRSRMKSKEFV